MAETKKAPVRKSLKSTAPKAATAPKKAIAKKVTAASLDAKLKAKLEPQVEEILRIPNWVAMGQLGFPTIVNQVTNKVARDVPGHELRRDAEAALKDAIASPGKLAWKTYFIAIAEGDELKLALAPLRYPL